MAAAITCYIAAAMGAFGSLLGLWLAVQTICFVRKAERTQGVILGNEARLVERKGACHFAYHPKFQFVDRHSQTHSITSDDWFSRKVFREGDAVEVFYDPLNPQEARINSFTQLWAAPVLMTLVPATSALGFLAAALWITPR
jgi:hypothetical protein